MATANLTAARLREVLHYDPDTGIFTWLKRVANRVQIGDIAGAVGGPGYRSTTVDGRKYTMHRLAWLYAYGSWPSGDIDHINGVRLDNRMSNLRDVSRSMNLENQRSASARNRSGLLGVSVARHGKWEATIKVRGTRYHLGIFDTPEVAHAAYILAKRRLHVGCTI